MELLQRLRVLTASLVCLCGYFSYVYCINCPEISCPDNLPYCSPVGCVFECPNGSFTKDKQCQTDCGDEYILNDQCVNVCPHTARFVETDVTTAGRQFVKLQYCRTDCPPGTYAFQFRCLRSCPHDNKFVDDGVCKSSCGPDQIRLNITIDGQLTAIKCVFACVFDSRRYNLDGYCVSQCNSDQVVYKGNCQKTCPPEFKIKDTNEDGIMVCKNKCDAWQRPYVQNGICVAKCRTDLVSVKNVCSTKCPDNMTLKYIDDAGNTHCIDKCNAAFSGYFLEGDYCVSRCKQDHLVYGTRCVKQCPKNAPVHVTDKDEWGIQHVYCRFNCTGGSRVYVYNDTCVETCPHNSKYVFNATCLNKCPNEAPFHCTGEQNWRCVSFSWSYGINNIDCQSECPFSLKAYHYECHEDCPSGTYSLQDSCVDNCNGSAPYISKKACVTQCPVDTFPKEGVCTQCPVDTFSSIVGCTNSKLNCTSKQPYRNTDGHCVSKCNSYEIIDDNKCINKTQCLKKMVFRGYCTDLCPVGFVYYSAKKDIPCMAKKNIIRSMCLCVLLGVCVIIAMLMFLSTKKCDCFKLPICTSEQEDDVAPLLIEEHETLEIDRA